MNYNIDLLREILLKKFNINFEIKNLYDLELEFKYGLIITFLLDNVTYSISYVNILFTIDKNTLLFKGKFGNIISKPEFDKGKIRTNLFLKKIIFFIIKYIKKFEEDNINLFRGEKTNEGIKKNNNFSINKKDQFFLNTLSNIFGSRAKIINKSIYNNRLAINVDNKIIILGPYEKNNFIKKSGSIIEISKFLATFLIKEYIINFHLYKNLNYIKIDGKYFLLLKYIDNIPFIYRKDDMPLIIDMIININKKSLKKDNKLLVGYILDDVNGGNFLKTHSKLIIPIDYEQFKFDRIIKQPFLIIHDILSNFFDIIEYIYIFNYIISVYLKFFPELKEELKNFDYLNYFEYLIIHNPGFGINKSKIFLKRFQFVKLKIKEHIDNLINF
ncbi:MAG: hypothetical protein PHO80_02660 [Candidatus Gracilibacteria bacterium]|nr:hypothetical protein [Candidatus Gracilibacteria bacterium]